MNVNYVSSSFFNTLDGPYWEGFYASDSGRGPVRPNGLTLRVVIWLKTCDFKRFRLI